MSEIQLKKFQTNDFQVYFDTVKDDEVMKFITGKGLTEKEAETKFNSILNLNSENKDLGYFIVYKGKTVLGECKLVNDEKDTTQFEIGYILKKEYWGRGIGSMICRKLLNLAELIDPNKGVIALIDPSNIASKKLLLKFGFESFSIGTEDNVETEKLIFRPNTVIGNTSSGKKL